MNTPPKKPHPDTARLEALISLVGDAGYDFGGRDFDEYLFHERKAPNELVTFRRALDRWIRDGRA